jgi:hypothetical protein
VKQTQAAIAFSTLFTTQDVITRLMSFSDYMGLFQTSSTNGYIERRTWDEMLLCPAIKSLQWQTLLQMPRITNWRGEVFG